VETVVTTESSTSRTAPEPLELVQQFVNSLHLEPNAADEEELTDPGALRAWLSERGLMEPDEPVSEGDLRRAIDVREGLRALLLANNGLPFDEAKVERLDRAASRAGMRVRFCAEEPELVPDAAGVDGAIARLMSIVAAAVSHGAWERMKACSRQDCYWAFYDHSKNRSGKWCSMETCGNVEKAKAYRQRHRGREPRSGATA
jgi:predicted RNA-binding Zn ribbon-like protein